MIKSAKKTLALFLAFVMVTALCVPSFADGESTPTTGSITIRNSTPSATYTLYKIFDLTYSDDGVSYSYTSTGTGDTLKTLLETMFTFTSTQVENVYAVTAKEAKTGADIGAFFKSNIASFTAAAGPTTATTDTLTFEGLSFGYYFIDSSVGATVSVDSTIPDVTIIDKNQTPGWKDNGKKIVGSDGSETVSSAKYGDTVNFEIDVHATAYVDSQLAPYYYISDTLGEGFSPATDIAVTVDGTTVTKDTDYTVTQTGNNFEITLKFGEKYGSEADIKVTYSATVQETAVIAGAGNPNTANFTYDRKTVDPDQPTVPDEPGEKQPYNKDNTKTTTTYVYALGILKVDPKGKHLTGAEFTVTKNDVSKDAISITADATSVAGVYAYNSTATTTNFEVGSDGVLIVKGLDAGNYTIAEVVSPAGYNLLKDTVTMSPSISETGNYTQTITTYFDAEGNVVATKDESSTSVDTSTVTNVVPLTIVNQAGKELPSTGGIGTTIFYALGGVLLVGAAVLLITKKRMNVQ